MNEIRMFAVHGVPLVQAGDDLATVLLAALATGHLELQDDDIVVICQKVVSKAEGRTVRYTEVSPSALARSIAADSDKDGRIVEVILRETRRIVRMDQGHLIVETRHGWICANAGVDESNVPDAETLVLLPEDPDRSARQLRDRITAAAGARIAVVITDTFGRPWREGLVEFALGAAGIEALLDLRGESDLAGRPLHHTIVAQIDEIAAASGLLMRKGEGIPAVVVRGYRFRASDDGAATLRRAPNLDLFR